jgi:hypothetical protein
MGVAGGGAGGGGGGRRSGGQSAPGSAGQASIGQAGQDGQDKSADGGGGGGGGGNSGNGGTVNPGDEGANAGFYGYSQNANPSGQSPGRRFGAAGVGGGATQPGNAGAAQIFFDIPGLFAHDGTRFRPVQKQYVKTAGVWQEINEVYVKQGGSWNLIVGSLPAVFNTVGGSFGVASRPQAPEVNAPVDFRDFGGGSGYELGQDSLGGLGGRGSVVRDGSNNPVGDGFGGYVTSSGDSVNADGSVGNENRG